MRSFISGWSCFNPLGSSREEFTRRLFAAESGIVPVRERWGLPHDFPVPYAGLIKDTFFPPLGDNLYSLETEILLGTVLEEIFSESNQQRPVDLIVLAGSDRQFRWGELFGVSSSPQLNVWERFNPYLVSDFVHQRLARFGQRELPVLDQIQVLNGCVTTVSAIGYASQRIRMGRNKRALVLNWEPRVRPEDLIRYNALGVLMREDCPAHKASRPFSVDRGGFVKSEGSGAFLVESEESVNENSGRVCAEVLGYAMNSEAYRLTEPREDGSAISEVMLAALTVAKLSPSRVDYINAHGTGTRKNDEAEIQAIRRVFGELSERVPISSTKSQLGHLNTASGSGEIAACLLAFENQILPPSLNHLPNPGWKFDFVPEVSRPAKVQFVLKNSFGFGGANASLVLAKV